jgi:hypothetical protein
MSLDEPLGAVAAGGTKEAVYPAAGTKGRVEVAVLILTVRRTLVRMRGSRISAERDQE